MLKEREAGALGELAGCLGGTRWCPGGAGRGGGRDWREGSALPVKSPENLVRGTLKKFDRQR